MDKEKPQPKTPELIPGAVRSVDDLFNIPRTLRKRIERELEMEAMREFLDARK